jgi:signal transduction histidine kinase
MPYRLPAARTFDIRGVQLIALLVVAVVVPSASVLWFMNEAVASQAAASHAALTDAHRAQLRVVRERLRTHFAVTAQRLEANLPREPAAAFRQLVAAGAVDSAIVRGLDDTSGYPSLDRTAPAASEESIRARAIQEAVRPLVAARRNADAVDLIARYLLVHGTRNGLDAAGRSIAADSQLLMVELLPDGARRRAAVAELTAHLNDYSTAALSSPQRTFLMNQLQSQPGAAPIRFATLPAERLALAFLESDRPVHTIDGLRATSSPTIWQMASAGRRVLALYKTDTLIAAARAAVSDASGGLDLRVLPPGAPADDEAIAIGSPLQGWEISFGALPPVESLSAARRNSYVVVALMAIAAGVVAVGFAGAAARRQTRLASLRSDLVSAVSHELKTPVASMRLLVDSLLDDERLDEAKTRDYLQLMAGENERLTRLIENFLTFSRLERKRQQFTFRPTRPADIAAQALAALPRGRRGADAPRIEIDADLPLVTADIDALVTVLLNLLDNAYKYTPGDHRIAVRVAREADSVVFAVQDNGVGIAAREQKRIFGRFYRVDQRLAGAGGSGLGLSIVHAIVRAHGGRIQVRSAPGEGSTFAVHLPSLDSGVAA